MIQNNITVVLREHAARPASGSGRHTHKSVSRAAGRRQCSGSTQRASGRYSVGFHTKCAHSVDAAGQTVPPSKNLRL